MTKDTLLKYLSDPKIKRGLVVTVAAVVMHFSPDYVDEIIKTLLVTWGITDIATAVNLSK